MTLIGYPDNWNKITQEIKRTCGWRCMCCDRQCRRPGELYLGWDYELTIAHWDHDYDSAEIYVVACCARCHFLHDAPFVWVARRRVERWRRIAAGQMELMPTRAPHV